MLFAWEMHDAVTAWGVLFLEGCTSLNTYSRAQRGMKGKPPTITGLWFADVGFGWSKICGNIAPTQCCLQLVDVFKLAVGGQACHAYWCHIYDFKSGFCSGS